MNKQRAPIFLLLLNETIFTTEFCYFMDISKYLYEVRSTLENFEKFFILPNKHLLNLNLQDGLGVAELS